MKLFLKAVLVVFLIIGFSPYESYIASANLHENEILTDLESYQLSQILSSEIINQLDSIVDVFSVNKRFSGNVLVAIAGQEIYSRSVGYADPLKKELAKRGTIFQLASVSKQFTSAAVMLLKSDGRLEFTDLLSKYIPELPYEGVTIQDLLQHTAGLPNYMYLIDKYWKNDCSPDNEDVIELMVKYKLPMFFKPGSRYDYSNTGYVILATIVQRISGLPLNEFLQRRVFQPLGMLNTFVYSTADSTCQHHQVSGFRATRGGYVRYLDSHHDGVVGDKGICSTAEDMFKWDKALYLGSPISHDVLEIAFTPAITKSGKVIPYGFGFRIRDDNGSKVVYHNGIWEGFRTNFHRFVNTKNTIIVLNNTSVSTNHELVGFIESAINDNLTALYSSTLTRMIIDQGLDSALKYYNEQEATDEVLKFNILKLMEASDYMRSIGKEKKAEEIKEFCSAISSN